MKNAERSLHNPREKYPGAAVVGRSACCWFGCSRVWSEFYVVSGVDENRRSGGGIFGRVGGRGYERAGETGV